LHAQPEFFELEGGLPISGDSPLKEKWRVVGTCRGNGLEMGIREKGVPVSGAENVIYLGEYRVCLGIGPSEAPTVHMHVF
jgi:hypothetical protein